MPSTLSTVRSLLGAAAGIPDKSIMPCCSKKICAPSCGVMLAASAAAAAELREFVVISFAYADPVGPANLTSSGLLVNVTYSYPYVAPPLVPNASDSAEMERLARVYAATADAVARLDALLQRALSNSVSMAIAINSSEPVMMPCTADSASVSGACANAPLGTAFAQTFFNPELSASTGLESPLSTSISEARVLLKTVALDGSSLQPTRVNATALPAALSAADARAPWTATPWKLGACVAGAVLAGCVALALAIGRARRNSREAQLQQKLHARSPEELRQRLLLMQPRLQNPLLNAGAPRLRLLETGKQPSRSVVVVALPALPPPPPPMCLDSV